MFTDIRTLLKNAGHDSSYWFDILQQQFRTTEVQDIQSLEHGTLEAIANCAKEKEDIGVMLQFLISLKSQKQIVEEHNQNTSTNELWYDFLTKTGLYKYFPGKLGVQEVMKVQKETSDYSDDTVNILAFLKRLIMLDNTARDTFDATLKVSKKTSGGLAAMFSNLDDSDDSDVESTDENNEIHPLDFF